MCSLVYPSLFPHVSLSWSVTIWFFVIHFGIRSGAEEHLPHLDRCANSGVCASPSNFSLANSTRGNSLLTVARYSKSRATPLQEFGMIRKNTSKIIKANNLMVFGKAGSQLVRSAFVQHSSQHDVDQLHLIPEDVGDEPDILRHRARAVLKPLVHLDSATISIALGGVFICFTLTLLTCCWSELCVRGVGIEGIQLKDPISYNPHGLLSWQVYWNLSHTVWDNASLWLMSRRLCTIVLLVALGEYLLVSDPSSLDPLRFSQIGSLLTVFVSLLIGFFLTFAVTRWNSCIHGFDDLCSQIRQLHLQLHALGVPQVKIDMLLRYGVVSVWLLHRSLSQYQRGLNPEDKILDDEEIWNELEMLEGPYIELLPAEVALIRGSDLDPANLWMLVCSRLGSLANEGDVPPMTTPTYNVLLSFARNAQDAIIQVKRVGEREAPYVYTHTLAMIVHLNNLLSAVSFGLTLAACMASILVHIHPDLRLYSRRPHPNHLLVQDFQDLFIQFFRCVLTPILYQAFLEIGICISTPFGSPDAAIPIHRLMEQLQNDLTGASKIAANPPSWEAPSFKPRRSADDEKQLPRSVTTGLL